MKAVFLDLDGTLADSMPMLYNVYAAFMREHGLDPTRGEFQKLIGPTLGEAVAYLKKHYSIEENINELIGRYIAILEDHYRHKMELFPGAREFIIAAHGSGIKVAIVTAANEVLVKGFLNSQEILPYIDAIITPKGKDRGKPAPDLYLKALAACRVPPKEALAIEDSENGLLAARNAKIEAWKFDGWENITQRFIEKLERM